MSSVAQHLITVEEFEKSPNSEHRELVRGEVIDTLPSGAQAGVVTATVAMLLRDWAKRGSGGNVGVKAGFVLSRDPDTVRGPDVYYITANRGSWGGTPEGFWTLAPDLAIEIISPSETADEVQQKIDDFLAAGTPLVWVVYPRTEVVVVYAAGGMARTYRGEDVIEHPDVLPGFSCKVADLFA
jgi:Uma2 family endonuclease